MPIYEYDCDDCKEKVEVLVRGSETPACPTCGSESLTRRLSVVHAGNASPDPQPAPCRPGCCRIPS
ncbi:Zinc ribbon domain protein [Planctomycetes bacterium Pan216]|uniref:Zinc ribbon domain protein n=2 Tax=Kolteria novifilia TaxID=2527975 RepID=A0A518B983_9BACT|nr:Zinc ribbon domain protein [Planctomycetes bacterium Pan216]